jgi:hypothetical protein
VVKNYKKYIIIFSFLNKTNSETQKVNGENNLNTEGVIKLSSAVQGLVVSINWIQTLVSRPANSSLDDRIRARYFIYG